MGVMPGLAERSVSFDYPYVMTCVNCKSLVRLAGDEYCWKSHDDENAQCAVCGQDTPIGLDAMALRDDQDEVLDGQRLRTVAWYHTSTYPDWPNNQHLVPAEASDRMRESLGEAAADRERARSETLALHLGTYEAAIESMLRRMVNERALCAEWPLVWRGAVDLGERQASLLQVLVARAE